MAQTLQPVQSGDVIQANLMNQLIQSLNDLNTRVARLETGGSTTTTAGPPKITDFSPKTGLHELDTITVSGQNLWAAGMNSVYIDLNGALTPVVNFSTQSDSLLVFAIPGVFAQAAGSFVALRVVSPTQGSDSVTFSLLPAPVVIPSGDVRIQLSDAPGTVFNPGTFTLGYTLNANTTLGDTYDLKTAINGAGWTATTDTPSVFIAPAASSSTPTIVKGTITLVIPPGASGSANLTLTATSRLNPLALTRSSAPAVIPVGGSALISAGIGLVPEPPAGSTDSSGTLLVPAGVNGLSLIFLTTVVAPGSYVLSTRFDNDAANWSTQFSTPVPIPTANVPKPVTVVVMAKAGALPTNLYVKLVSSTDNTIATETFYPVRTK